VQNTITSGRTATGALEGSTEEAQFGPMATSPVAAPVNGLDGL
jgi:hypothetical protein